MPDETTVANTGSRARDHLANERTFLAWVRTALGTVALAIAVERFAAEDDDAGVVAFAVVLVVMGLSVLAMATRRYFTVARDLDQGQFRVDHRSPWIILVGGVALAVLSLVVFLA